MQHLQSRKDAAYARMEIRRVRVLLPTELKEIVFIYSIDITACWTLYDLARQPRTAKMLMSIIDRAPQRTCADFMRMVYLCGSLSLIRWAHSIPIGFFPNVLDRLNMTEHNLCPSVKQYVLNETKKRELRKCRICRCWRTQDETHSVHLCMLWAAYSQHVVSYRDCVLHCARKCDIKLKLVRYSTIR